MDLNELPVVQGLRKALEGFESEFEGVLSLWVNQSLRAKKVGCEGLPQSRLISTFESILHELNSLKDSESKRAYAIESLKVWEEDLKGLDEDGITRKIRERVIQLLTIDQSISELFIKEAEESVEALRPEASPTETPPVDTSPAEASEASEAPDNLQASSNAFKALETLETLKTVKSEASEALETLSEASEAPKTTEAPETAVEALPTEAEVGALLAAPEAIETKASETTETAAEASPTEAAVEVEGEKVSEELNEPAASESGEASISESVIKSLSRIIAKASPKLYIEMHSLVREYRKYVRKVGVSGDKSFKIYKMLTSSIKSLKINPSTGNSSVAKEFRNDLIKSIKAESRDLLRLIKADVKCYKESRDSLQQFTPQAITSESLQHSLPQTVISESPLRESWTSILGFRKDDKVVFSDLTEYARNTSFDNVEEYTSLLRRVVSELNRFKNKGFHDGKENLPVINDFILEFFTFSKGGGECLKPESGDNFCNEWMLNVVYLNLYIKCLMIIKELKVSPLAGEHDDKLTDLESVGLILRDNLHPSVKAFISLRGIKVIQDIYAAFDTEYQGIEGSFDKNELLSIQLACNTGVYFKIPKRHPFRMMYVNPSSSGKSLMLVEGELDERVKELVEKSIDRASEEYYSFVHGEYWSVLDMVRDIVSKVGGVVKNDLDAGSTIFSLPFTDVSTRFKLLNEYSSTDLFADVIDLMEGALNSNNTLIGGVLSDVPLPIHVVKAKGSDDITKAVSSSFLKKTSRFTVHVGEELRLNISTERNFYLASHYTAADLSMLKDFDDMKSELDIVQKSFVTRGKGLKATETGVVRALKANKRLLKDTSKDLGFHLHVRDTWLLAPGNSKSLNDIGKSHTKGDEDYAKEDLGIYRTRMKDLLKDDPAKFESYAVKDVKIVLKHINELCKTYFELGRIGVPLTLTGISTSYILSEWARNGYEGYQVNAKYLLGNVGRIATPHGLHALGDIGLYLPFYTSSYRGGRNESFMFGRAEGTWYDYDLSSAYTTAMCFLGHPDYHGLKVLRDKGEVDQLPKKAFFRSYMALEVKYKFPSEVKYPCIPENIDDSTTVYASSGKSVINGLEYFLAKALGCEFDSVIGVMIPYKTEGSGGDDYLETIDDYKNSAPFLKVEKLIQAERRKYPPKSFGNLSYKERGNSGYGLTSKGLGGKRKFDIKTGGTVEMSGGVFSSPLICSSITALVRCVVGECLNNVNLLGGRVLSVTTDGFLTDVNYLEDKLLKLPEERITFLKSFRLLRRYLADDPQALEIKHEESGGILSWTTRGQLGCGEGGVKATTGFQSSKHSRESLYKEFSEVLQGNGEILYVQESLRGAKSLYENGGHMGMEYKDQSYRLVSDIRRRIISVSGASLFDSEPWDAAESSKAIRSLVKIVKGGTYNKYLSRSKAASYKRPIELGVRSFIRWVMLNGLKENGFKNYQSLIDFVKLYDSLNPIKISRSSVSQLKTQLQYKVVKRNTVPRIPEVLKFFEYVKQRLPNFDGESLLK